MDSIPVARLPTGPKIREWARKHRFADWRVARLAKLAELAAEGPLGRQGGVTGKFLDGVQKKAPAYVRANTLRMDPDELQKRLIARGFDLEPTQMDPTMFRVHHAPTPLGATHEHMQGFSVPMDLASAAGPLALAPGNAEVVADLAAAPGMKTLHLSAQMENQGSIVAVEPHEQRMRSLRFNLERCGAQNVVLRQELAQDTPGEAWADRVLLDAPCTGEGTMPKDRKRRRGNIEEIRDLCSLQSEIIEAADRVLRPGGTMIYATCTFAPEENEAQAQRLLDKGYKVEPVGIDACEGVPLAHGVTEWPGLELDDSLKHARRFMPGLHPTLGFFLVKLRKGDEA